MRELAVYYCPKCGYYAYYQLPKKAYCPRCETSMSALQLGYQKFMDLNLEERDQLLSKEIIQSYPSISARLAHAHNRFNHRELIADLTYQINELMIENKKLTYTTEWMHKTIWELLRKNKRYEQLYAKRGKKDL